MIGKIPTNAFLGICAAMVLIDAAVGQSTRPNIVYIFVDDLGAGEVGFTNPNAQIDTPHLDQLANSGLHFTQAYATAICSPSRGALYTGYHSGHAVNDENVENFRDEDIMPGEVLKAAGYGTAVYGKWGFGATTGTSTGNGGVGNLRINPTVTDVDTLPTSHGYDEFVGYLNHVQAHRFFVDPLWQDDAGSATGVSHYATGNNAGDNTTNTFAAYTDDIHTDEAIGFIGSQAASGTPFLLQMHYNSPHPPHDPGAVLTTAYGDYDGAGDTTMYDDYLARGMSVVQAERAAMISRLDEHVGALADALRDPNGDGDQSDSILSDTIIMFTSDNGGEFVGDQEDIGGNRIYGDDLRGTKRDLYEGGVRVPMFAYWEGTINPGVSHAINLDTDGDGTADAASTGHIIDLPDFLATAAELSGQDAPIGIDGVSYAGLLTGQQMLRKRGYHIWEHHEQDGDDPDTREARWSVLKDNVKLISYADGSFDLFDLATNPEELAAGNLLDTGLQQWQDLKEELTAIAQAEGAVNGDLVVQHVNWIGADGDKLDDSQKWSNYSSNKALWVSVINNTTPSDAVATADYDARLLGVEVRGDGAQQTVRVNRHATLAGWNEVRIGSGARVQLDQATLESNRWVDVKAGGELTGHGAVAGDVYNWGTIAPGLPEDLGQPDTSSNPIDIDTGVVPAVVFDFTGVQDDSPLTQTSTLNQYVTLSQGLEFGPGTSPRNADNKDNEFNVARWNTLSKAEAVAADDYIGFSAAPVSGVEMLVDQVSITLWRNGTGAAKSHGIFTSVEGFDAGSEIGLWEDFFEADDTSPQTLTAVYSGGQWSSSPTEVRLYGWDTSSTTSLGNTHITAVSMTASFRSVDDPAVALDPTGVLTFAGDFFHVEGALIRMQLGGVSLSDPLNPEYDRLIVDGAVELAGDLVVTLTDGFLPQAGDAFDLFDWGSISGDFGSVELPGLETGLKWDTTDLLTTGVIAVAVALPGDFNDDGMVDASDYAVWRNELGATGLAPYSGADADGDGNVTTEDYQIWREHYGESNGQSADTQAVPEPSAVVLLLGVLAAWRPRR